MRWLTVNSFLLMMLMLPGCHSVSPSFPSKQADASMALAVNYLNHHQYEMAKRYLQMSYQRMPHSPLLWDALAYYEELTGNFALADQDYRYAIQLNSQLGAVHNNYGVFLCHRGAYNKAREQFLTALKQAGYENYKVAYKNLRACCQKIKNCHLVFAH